MGHVDDDDDDDDDEDDVDDDNVNLISLSTFDFIRYAIRASVSCFNAWNALPQVYPVRSVVRWSTFNEFNALRFMLTIFTNHNSFFRLK